MLLNKLIYGDDAIIDISTQFDLDGLEDRLTTAFHCYRKSTRYWFSILERKQPQGFVYCLNKKRLSIFSVPGDQVELSFDSNLPDASFEGKIEILPAGIRLYGSVGLIPGYYSKIIFSMVQAVAFCMLYILQPEPMQILILFILISTSVTVSKLVLLTKSRHKVEALGHRIRSSLEPSEQMIP